MYSAAGAEQLYDALERRDSHPNWHHADVSLTHSLKPAAAAQRHTWRGDLAERWVGLALYCARTVRPASH